MIYPDNLEVKVGFDQIRNLVKSRCLSPVGKEEVDRSVYLTDAESIRAALEETDEFRTICLLEESYPVNNFNDLSAFLSRIKPLGTYLEIHEIIEIRKSLFAIKELVNFFKKRKDDEYPELRKRLHNINVFPFLHKRIELLLTRNGEIKDNASPELLKIRREIQSKQSAISVSLNRILKKAQKDGLVEQDVNPAIRDGRMVIPVPSTFKRRIQGLVHDESATGKTSYVEPVEAVEMNNAIKELSYAEKREIIKILIAFTDEIRPYSAELTSINKTLGYFDFLRAKALFAISIDAIKPGFNSDQTMKWSNAVHPLLLISFRKEKRKVVPLDISLAPDQRIILISGPNAGGKSVCLKTVGLLQYMFQSGFLVPVDGSSSFGMFEDVFIDIGDEQSLENDLSTYSSHLLNMKHFLKHAGEKSLLLIDEFGTGTEPALGGAIAESVLQEFNERGTYGVITTHYTNLKHFAESARHVVNAAMLYDTGQMRPIFQLNIGKPGSSFAFEIGRKIGLPAEILKRAEEKIGKGPVQFDKNLKDIARDKRYWEKKRKNIRTSEKSLEETLDTYNQELKELQKQRKQIIREAKSEAESILSGANKQVENTIRKIVESKAEKEATKKARKELSDFKEGVQRTSETDDKINQKIKKIKEKENRIKKKKPEPDDSRKDAYSKVPEVLKPGDKVRIEDQDVAGEILEIRGEKVMVSFGNIITNIELSKLKGISNNAFKEYQKNTGESSKTYFMDLNQRRLSFKPSLDMRGERGLDAQRILADYIDEAIMIGVSEVKILHGKGNGILREMVRDYLRSIDVVQSYRDEDVRFGGAGITIVRFQYS